MLTNAFKSYASSLARDGFKVAPTTSTLFQAKHSSSGTQTRENISPSPSQSTRPQSLSAFPSQQAPMDRSSATQRFPISRDSKASQPVPIRRIADSNWPACVHPTPGDDHLSGPQTSFTPTSYRRQRSTPFTRYTPTSNVPPDHRNANTRNVEVAQNEEAPRPTTDESLKRPHLLSLNTPPSLEECQPSLTQEQYERWSQDESRRCRIATGFQGGISSRKSWVCGAVHVHVFYPFALPYLDSRLSSSLISNFCCPYKSLRTSRQILLPPSNQTESFYLNWRKLLQCSV
jgi:hypothetical protein